jgi:hypothetical protein
MIPMCLQAKLEHPLLKSLQTSIESQYLNGRPLHQHKSAKSAKFDPKWSHFYVTSSEEFARLKATDVQQIFCDCHIVLMGTPPDDIKFDREGLKSVGSLTACQEIQGKVSNST